MDMTPRLLHAIIQSADSGLSTLLQLNGLVSDHALAALLQDRKKEYTRILQAARTTLSGQKQPLPAHINHTRLGSYMLFRLKNAGSNNRTVAEALLQGCFSGRLQLLCAIKDFPAASPEAKALAERLLHCEERFSALLENFL